MILKGLNLFFCNGKAPASSSMYIYRCSLIFRNHSFGKESPPNAGSGRARRVHLRKCARHTATKTDRIVVSRPKAQDPTSLVARQCSSPRDRPMGRPVAPPRPRQAASATFRIPGSSSVLLAWLTILSSRPSSLPPARSPHQRSVACNGKALPPCRKGESAGESAGENESESEASKPLLAPLCSAPR